MSLLEDVFAVEDNADNDIERVIDNNSAEGSGADSNDDRNDHSEAEEEAPRKVVPPGEKKVKVVRNPRVVLNPRRLTGPRGISTIEKFFSDFKFAGKGHEKEDLDMVMKTLEHWAHRLYPRFQFEDCIDKIATLGNKKEVDVHIRRIRMNMLLDDAPIVQQDSDEEMAEPHGGPLAPQLDEFDLLLDQQIALARSTPAHPRNGPFDSPMQREANDSFFAANTSPAPLPGVMSTPVRENLQTKTSSPQMNEEQKARMLKNRMIAEERRLARMKLNMIKEKEAASERIQTPDSTVPSEVNSRIQEDDSSLQTDTAHLKKNGEHLEQTPSVVEVRSSDDDVEVV